MDHDGYGNTLDVLPPRMPVTTKIITCLGLGFPINLHVPLVSSEGGYHPSDTGDICATGDTDDDDDDDDDDDGMTTFQHSFKKS